MCPALGQVRLKQRFSGGKPGGPCFAFCLPETRDDDRLLALWFWWAWDGLDRVLSEEQFDELLAGVEAATHPVTIRRRRQEHQRLRSEYGHLLPSEGVMRRRRALDGARPPRSAR